MKTRLNDSAPTRGYCPTCECSYATWLDECPVCKTPFLMTQPPAVTPTGPAIAYDKLVARVTAAGGVLQVRMTTVKVERSKTMGFPYFGYGFAWEKQLVGALDGSPVELNATEVSMAKRTGFPYVGFGFAWVRKLEGHVAGNGIALRSTAVEMDKARAFPYFGYGFAWTSEMTGSCGDQLRARLTTLDVDTRRETGFPYRAFGYAWVSEAELTLKLQD